MRITIDIEAPEGSTVPDIEVEDVWDFFYVKTEDGTTIKVTRVDDSGDTVTFS